MVTGESAQKEEVSVTCLIEVFAGRFKGFKVLELVVVGLWITG